MSIPVALVTLLRAHLDEHYGPAPDALVFSLVSGLPIRRRSRRARKGFQGNQIEGHAEIEWSG